jgi:hypothetical protein
MWLFTVVTFYRCDFLPLWLFTAVTFYRPPIFTAASSGQLLQAAAAESFLLSKLAFFSRSFTISDFSL